ncbi:MAG: hypothetical protein JXM69_06535 [Anaerolineae bacterium]|nr:hypothetical protein [Anaerolineae bacterium]
MAGLKDAIICLDMEAIGNLVDEVCGRDAHVGEVLATLADNFEYPQISAIIKGEKRVLYCNE